MAPLALARVARIVQVPAKGRTPVALEALPRWRTGQVRDPSRLGEVQTTSPDVARRPNEAVSRLGWDPLSIVRTAGIVVIAWAGPGTGGLPITKERAPST